MQARAAALVLPLLAGALAAQAVTIRPTGAIPLEERYVHPGWAVPRPSTGGGGAALLAPCYANDDLGSLVLPLHSQPDLFEDVGWGVKRCGSTSLVGAIGFAYFTTAMDPSMGGPGAALGLRLFVGTTGGGPIGMGTPVVDVVATGLPGSLDGNGVRVELTGTLGTPVRMPDGPIGWSYYGVDFETEPLGVFSEGGACASPLDPLTGTMNCFDFYFAPAGPGSFIVSKTNPTGDTSPYVVLYEEGPPVQASVTSFTFGANPTSYFATPAVLGEPWYGSVATTLTGHSFALVFGFDTPALLPLPGGQVLLASDGGGGELLGLAAQPGPLATFSFVAPLQLALIGKTLYTQALHFGGVTPFALSNRQALKVGTYR